PRLSPVTTFPPPTRNNGAIFYVVTDSATFSSGEIGASAGLSSDDPFATLHETAQALIAEIRHIK
ncbi:MAG: hypothetical protein ACREMF_04115, partial [Gemmatimonadales bacterium]